MYRGIIKIEDAQNIKRCFSEDSLKIFDITYNIPNVLYRQRAIESENKVYRTKSCRE